MEEDVFFAQISSSDPFRSVTAGRVAQPRGESPSSCPVGSCFRYNNPRCLSGADLMRRLLFKSLGVLELACAVVLAVIAWQLPGRAEVEEVSDRVEKVSQAAGTQVREL